MENIIFLFWFPLLPVMSSFTLLIDFSNFLSRADRRLICPFKFDTDSCHHLHLQSSFNIINVAVYILFKCVHIYIHANTYIYSVVCLRARVDLLVYGKSSSSLALRKLTYIHTFVCTKGIYMCMCGLYIGVCYARARSSSTRPRRRCRCPVCLAHARAQPPKTSTNRSLNVVVVLSPTKISRCRCRQHHRRRHYLRDFN